MVWLNESEHNSYEKCSGKRNVLTSLRHLYWSPNCSWKNRKDSELLLTQKKSVTFFMVLGNLSFILPHKWVFFIPDLICWDVVSPISIRSFEQFVFSLISETFTHSDHMKLDICTCQDCQHKIHLYVFIFYTKTLQIKGFLQALYKSL